MKNRKWSHKQKLEIVLEGIKGHVPVSELCNKHQISQAQYYDWKNHFLRHADRVFDMGKSTAREERLERENNRLKTLIGELTLELKKSDYED